MKKTLAKLVRYYHPRKGGWYHAKVLRQGRKWAVVEDLGNKSKHRIAVAELKEAS